MGDLCPNLDCRAGFENPNCPEVRNAYRMLTIRPVALVAPPPFYNAKCGVRLIQHVFGGPGYGLHVKMILRPLRSTTGDKPCGARFILHVFEGLRAPGTGPSST